MTTYIEDILDVNKLVSQIALGNISERFHPEFPQLVIYNYTEKVAYSGDWTEETLICRGLIVNLDTNEVLARPLRKFFNIGQAGAPETNLDTPVWHYANKEDGSLGIGYVRPDGKPAIATRGSFASDQAIHATSLLGKYEEDVFALWASVDVTPIYEIVYPDNRIVLDYGDRDELIPLGWIYLPNGEYEPVRYVEATTMRDLLTRPDRPNSEGWVIWLDPFTAVKFKQDDYIELHRIVTGLNRKSIWRVISTEGLPGLDALNASLPDELVVWADTTAWEIFQEYSLIMRTIDSHYISLLDYVYEEDVEERREMAAWVQKNVPREYVGMVFSLLDQKDIQEKVWKMVEPAGGGK